jgi:DNA-binding transcriptional ArsR family regulator
MVPLSKRATRTLTSDEAFVLLAHPLRVQILDALHEPDSAAGLARRIGATRQKVNYHLRELERAGLVEHAGERRAGNLMETLYRGVARSFLVPPRLTWTDPGRMQALQEQHSLERLVLAGERVQREAAVLLDRAAFDGDDIASLAVEAEVRLGNEAERAAFLEAYLEAIRPLLTKYGRKRGVAYRVTIAAYPDPGVDVPDQEGT